MLKGHLSTRACPGNSQVSLSGEYSLLCTDANQSTLEAVGEIFKASKELEVHR